MNSYEPLALIVMVAPIAAGALGVYVRHKIHALHQRIEARQRLDEQHRDAEAHLATPVQRLQQQLAAAEAVGARPAELAASFEAGWYRVQDLLQEHRVVTDSRVAKATAVLRHLRGLPPALRERTVAALYEVYRLPQAPQGGNGRGGGTGPAAVLALVGCFAISEPACAPPPAPIHRALICDASGHETARRHVCTTKAIIENFVEWARAAIHIPGSMFVLIQSAGAFEEVQISVRITIPTRGRGSPRAAQRRWLVENIGQLSRIKLHMDTFENFTVNKSNLIAGIVAATRSAALDLSGTVDLHLLSDGWLIGNGFNTERVVPEAKQVVDALQSQGIAWDLSRFSSVLLCGLHHEGADAARVAARDALWRELLQLGHVTRADFRTTCGGLFPPIPPGLLPRNSDTLAHENTDADRTVHAKGTARDIVHDITDNATADTRHSNGWGE